MQETFFTKRLICRKPTKNDIKTLSFWNSFQEANGEYLAVEKTSLEENLSKFDNNSFWNDNSKTYIIELKENKIPIGLIKFWAKTDENKTAMITVKIAIPQYRRKGLGTEVQKGLTRELFKKYGYNAIEMFTDINNEAQQKCLTRLDYDYIKTEEYTDAGETRQGHLYRLSKEKYEKSGVHIYYYD